MFFKSITVIILIFNYAESANILGVFPMGVSSHYILDYKLMKGLADAGHNVTIVAAVKQKTPLATKGNLTELVLDGFEKNIQQMLVDINFFGRNKQSMATIMKTMTDMFVKNANDTLYNPLIRELLNSGTKFDAVILEHFQNDALKVFSQAFDCPLIILSSLGPNSWINPTVGNPEEISYIRHFFFVGDPAKPLSVFERAKNIFLHVLDGLFRKFYIYPLHENLMKQAFPDAPGIYDLFANTSLVLLNSHSSLYPPQPLVPSMVEIGGYHIDPPQKLPKDLQEFMDSAQEGVVYFSMGSNLKSRDMSAEKKQAFLNVLGRLKQKVIWKFEEDLPGKPDNVLIRNWLPQQDILAHPNIKLFITHGGLLSTTETIYHGVPILAIPVFGDQPANSERAKYAGYGLKLDYHSEDFTEEKLGSLVEEMLNNPKYRENAQWRSKIFHDRPLKPLESAVFWVEYVIRHKGTRHLRVGSVNQPWYQYYLLDAVLLIVTSLVVVLGVLKFVLVRLYRIIRKKKQQKLKYN